MVHPNYSSYIRKKAILAACIILKKAPDTIDEFEFKI
jgi:hypothetical protein